MVLYHYNFGYPTVHEGVRLHTAQARVLPRNDRAREGWETWAEYSWATPLFEEQVDFHDVMDEDHFGHVDRVNRLVGVFGQEQGHEGQLLTMLGGVLVAALPGLRVGHDVGVPDHLFEAVGL